MKLVFLVDGSSAVHKQNGDGITPIGYVDKIQVGKGVAGPITRRLQEEFFALTSGTEPDRHNWLAPINAPVAATSR